jgi:CheY-like chemotaxis protein
MRCSILLVEKSLAMRDFFERAMALPGAPEATCTAAASSRDALEELGQHSFDLIVMDTNAFGPGEGEFLDRLRSDSRLQNIPFIVISADVTAARIQNMLDLGAAAYLCKPLPPAALCKQLNQTLQNAHARH